MSVDKNLKTRSTSTLIDHIQRVDLRVRSIDRALEFYRDIVGLDVAQQEGDRASLRAPGGPPLLSLSSEGVDSPADRRATGLFHVAIRYPNRRALADALVRLVAADRQPGTGDHGVSEALYVDDPDGNGIELYWDRPRGEWPEPPPGERVRMYTMAVDLNDLVGEADLQGDGRTTAPAGTDVGHVHLQVGDLERTIAFYRDALGLDLMTTLANQAAFFSSNDYHHHVGANIWNSRGREPATRTSAGLDRVVFNVATRSDLDRTRDRLTSLGHEVSGSENELIVRDPDGIELRFVTEG